MKHRLPVSALRSQIALILAVTLILATVSGCSWFGGKDKGGEVVEVMPPAGDSGFDSVPPSDAPVEGPRPGSLTPMPEMNTIYFDYDRAQVRPDQLDHVDQNLQYLVEHPEVKVLIEGHCDERGTVEYNFNLGNRRANTVREYFVRNGILPERLAVRSKGEEEPVETGHNEAAWAQNRRCEFLRMN